MIDWLTVVETRRVGLDESQYANVMYRYFVVNWLQPISAEFIWLIRLFTNYYKITEERKSQITNKRMLL